MVREDVLLKCFSNTKIEEILIINSRSYEGKRNAKMKELIVPNFLYLEEVKEWLKDYNTYFYCAGKSSVRMNEMFWK